MRISSSLPEMLALTGIVWDNVWGFDYSPLKKTAMSEPLVDTVDMKAIVTDPAAIITLDLYKVQPKDLAFRVPYQLKARRNDFVHALIAWFDIEFTACHKPVKFSTGPHTKYTHWKQTVFYLTDVLTVEENETISGYLENKPSEKNHRDLDIKIEYKLDTEDMHRQSEGKGLYKMYVFCFPSIASTYANSLISGASAFLLPSVVHFSTRIILPLLFPTLERLSFFPSTYTGSWRWLMKDIGVLG